MKIKKYIVILFLLLTPILSVNAEEDNVVSVWAGEENLVILRFAADKYNEINGENTIQLKETTIGAPDIYQKITTGMQAGGQSLGDIMLVEENAIGDYIQNFSEHLINVSEYGFDDLSNEIVDTKIEAIRGADGDLYGIPFDVGPTGIFYRKDVFEELGIDMNEIETWEDFIEVADRVTNETDFEMLAADLIGGDELYRALMNQQDSFYFDNNDQIALDSEESKNALELMLELQPYTYQISSFSDGVQAVIGNRVATMPAGVWYTGTLRTQAPEMKGKWGAIPFPAFESGGNRNVNLGGSSFLLSKQAKNPDLVYDFMSFFATDPEVQSFSLSQSGIFPSFKGIDPVEIMKDDDYFDAETWDVFVSQLDGFNASNFRDLSIASDTATNMVGNVMNGQDIDTATEQAVEQLQSMIE